MRFLPKFLVWNGMLIWLGIFYYGPQWFPLRPPCELSPGQVDNRIPFIPETAWIYQSLFFLLPLATILQPDRERLFRFAGVFCLLVLAFSIFFWLCPTQLHGPFQNRPEWAYQHLVAAVDGRRNALPSLHAALTVYAAGSIVLRYRGSALVWGPVLVWSFLLLFSTLTTKQHVLSDILLGGALGLIALVLALVRRPLP